MSASPTTTSPTPPPDALTKRRRPLWPFIGFGIFVLGMVIVGRFVDLNRHIQIAQAWTGALGALAPAAYVVLYVVATLLGAPGTPFTLLCPFLFGVVPAIAIMVVASILAAVFGFLIARYFARDAFVERLGGTETYRRLAALVEQHDWLVIPILRILPIAPFTMVNYGFGLTGITFWRYFLWSTVAMIPMDALLVMGADLFYDATTYGRVAWPLIVGVVTTALLVGALVVLGRKTLARL
jgi:uncharacterized membrane protein YdjX (TVP38/TMEM64 family)